MTLILKSLFLLTLIGFVSVSAGNCSGKVSGLKLEEDEDTHDLTVSWTAPSGESGCTYTISYTNNAQNFKSLSFETDKLSYVIERELLVPCSITKIGVKTTGGSEVTGEVEMQIQTSKPPVLLDMTTSCDSIEMTWEGQSYNENMCVHTHFQLFCLSDTHNFTVPQEVTDEANRIFQISLNKVLKPDIYYTCNGYMFVTLGGFTDASKNVAFWSNLDAVRALEVTEDNNLIRASWEPPLNSKECGVGYQVEYENDVLGSHKLETAEVFIDLDAEIIPCTKYDISVTPISGTGSLGTSVSALYEPAVVAGSVSDVAANDDGETLTVSWTPINIGKCDVKFVVDHYVDGGLKDTIETVNNVVELERIPCSENKIEVSVINNGEPGNPVVLELKLSSSDIQEISQVEDLTVSGNKVTWSAPISVGKCGVMYEVIHVGPTGTTTNTISTTETTLELIPCSENVVTVRGVSGSLTGKDASVDFKADSADLNAPETLRILPDFITATLTLQAESKDINSCPITEVLITCQQDGDDSAFGTSVEVSDNDERVFDVELAGLVSDKIYECKLRWSNSPMGEHFRFRTIPIPKNTLQVVDITENSFKIIWNEEYGKEFVNDYKLSIKSNGPNYVTKDGCDYEPSKEFTFDLKADDDSYEFLGGFPAYGYDILLLTTYNLGSLGVTNDSDDLNADTLSDVPGTPANLKIEFDYEPGAAYNVTGIITWDSPCELNGNLKSFGVKVSATFDFGGTEQTVDYSLDVKANSPNDVFKYELGDINPFFRYVISVNTRADFDSASKDLVINPPDICSCSAF